MCQKKGISLVEIIITVVILSMMSTFAIPRYRMVLLKGKAIRASNILKQIMDAEILYYSTNQAYINLANWVADPSGWSAMGMDIPNDPNFNYGFWSTNDTVDIVMVLGGPAAYAMPKPYTSSAWGNRDYFEVGVSRDGRFGLKDATSRTDIW